MANFHFGANCKHLKRYKKYEPADCRCSVAIKRYDGADYSFLDTKVWVPAAVAAKELCLEVANAVRKAKAGELPMRYAENVSQRITVTTKKGQKDVTLQDAAKRMKISLNEINKRINSGELHAFYLDIHIQIEITNRWPYEKCFLWNNGGLCKDFEPHDKPQITYLAQMVKS